MYDTDCPIVPRWCVLYSVPYYFSCWPSLKTYSKPMKEATYWRGCGICYWLSWRPERQPLMNGAFTWWLTASSRFPPWWFRWFCWLQALGLGFGVQQWIRWFGSKVFCFGSKVILLCQILVYGARRSDPRQPNLMDILFVRISWASRTPWWRCQSSGISAPTFSCHLRQIEVHHSARPSYWPFSSSCFWLTHRLASQFHQIYQEKPCLSSGLEIASSSIPKCCFWEWIGIRWLSSTASSTCAFPWPWWSISPSRSPSSASVASPVWPSAISS